MLDIEVSLNNRPLRYIENDIAYQPLTPSCILFERHVVLATDQEVAEDEGEVFGEQQKYVLKCKKQRGEDFIANTW